MSDKTKLSPRRQDCARLAADGLQSKEIARRMGLSMYTVSDHLSQVYQQLGVRNRTELAAAMVRLGYSSSVASDASDPEERRDDASARPPSAGSRASRNPPRAQ